MPPTRRKKLIVVALPLEAINSADQYILALTEARDGQAATPRHVREPFKTEPDFDTESRTTTSGSC